MKSATLLALSLMVVGVWPQDGVMGQTSAAAPVSLAPPKASPARAGTKNPPATSDGVSSTPATSGLPQLANPAPAADYDGFSVGNEDNDTTDRAMPPVRLRAAKKRPRRANVHRSGRRGVEAQADDLPELQIGSSWVGPLSVSAQGGQNAKLQQVVSNLSACVRAHASMARAAGVQTRSEAVDFFRERCRPPLGEFAPANVGAIPPGLFPATIGDEWVASTR